MYLSMLKRIKIKAHDIKKCLSFKEDKKNIAEAYDEAIENLKNEKNKLIEKIEPFFKELEIQEPYLYNDYLKFIKRYYFEGEDRKELELHGISVEDKMTAISRLNKKITMKHYKNKK